MEKISTSSISNKICKFYIKIEKRFILLHEGKFTEFSDLKLSEIEYLDFGKLNNLKKNISSESEVINAENWILAVDQLNYKFITGIEISHQKSTEAFEIYFAIQPNLINWISDYNFTEFYKNLFEILSLKNYEAIPLKSKEPTAKFLIGFRTKKNDITIAQSIEKYSLNLSIINQEVVEKLKGKDKNNSIVGIFDFPEDLKIPCEQYLLYFAQFLQDLGINATSNLKEEAGKVLFLVTPTDDLEALDKIREALAVYLSLPSSLIVYDDGFAAMRLQQQIENLQHSQRMTEREIRSSERELRLAQTVIEHQDKLILQKDAVIEQQSKIIEKITSTSIMMDSLENKEEFEKVFDGLEFGESKELKEKLGIKFNPVTSLKSLGKKLSGRDEEITSLNLNDETDKIIER